MKAHITHEPDTKTNCPALMIAATESGGGKTSVSLAFMAALHRRGVKVLPFKCGPDYIDPLLHQKACLRPSYNLDAWIMEPQACLELFRQVTQDNSASDLPTSNEQGKIALPKIALLEGVMGLFDGAAQGLRQGKSPLGSSAFLAKTLGIPVILTLNASSRGQSIAALAQGFANFDPDLPLAGLLVNQVASAKHRDLIRAALKEHCPELPLLALLPRQPEIAVPSRHLGLEVNEQQNQSWLDALADWLEHALELEGHNLTELLVSLGESLRPSGTIIAEVLSEPKPCTEIFVQNHTLKNQSKPRIGIARDEAFSFHYAGNHLALQQAGAELVFFSPLHDRQLPADLNGLWLGGGYPELYAEGLSKNRSFLHSLRQFCHSGAPVWAECGGFIYLSNGLEDADGNFWPWAGVFDLHTRLEQKRQGLGYVSAEFLQPSPVCAAGETCKGHIFHYSRIIDTVLPTTLTPLHHLSNARGEPVNSASCHKINTACAGSFLHLMFAPNNSGDDTWSDTGGDSMSRHFVQACLNKNSNISA